MDGGSGRKRVLSGLAGIAVLVGAVWRNAHRSSQAIFTGDERGPFVTVESNGERRLVHPALGFSLLHPGPGFVAAGSQAFRPDAQFYSFADRDAHESLTIGVFKGMGDRPHALRKLIDSMAAHASGLAGGSGERVEVVQMDVPDDEPVRGQMHAIIHAVIHAIIGKKMHYRLRAYGWSPPHQVPIAVLIAVMSPSADAHEGVLTSFLPGVPQAGEPARSRP
jgi:hypothetical protein